MDKSRITKVVMKLRDDKWAFKADMNKKLEDFDLGVEVKNVKLDVKVGYMGSENTVVDLNVLTEPNRLPEFKISNITLDSLVALNEATGKLIEKLNKL